MPVPFPATVVYNCAFISDLQRTEEQPNIDNKEPKPFFTEQSEEHRKTTHYAGKRSLIYQEKNYLIYLNI